MPKAKLTAEEILQILEFNLRDQRRDGNSSLPVYLEKEGLWIGYRYGERYSHSDFRTCLDRMYSRETLEVVA